LVRIAIVGASRIGGNAAQVVDLGPSRRVDLLAPAHIVETQAIQGTDRRHRGRRGQEVTQ
jgi:hypothetical protein